MGWWKTAKPGDKVVCVSLPTKSNLEPAVFAPIEVGKVYIIENIEIDSWFKSGAAVSVGFYWMSMPMLIGAHLFRPVQTKSTEASMKALRKHLTGKTAEVV